ncbi:hypothetical protein F3Y22_tig00110187pilonHSYRG00325 [Hibiscus syriacus]|uniref:Uncharacterized protein n=1 Tax=Hibiscus syriacus TaxID=106335 RepID=A0A6A3BD39_HIBSY|nr:hypothetical protein F3Y22_tig00110187pilonHSYRG00325 [Hibiscus syriacus]
MGFSGLLLLPQSLGVVRFIWGRHSAAILVSITALMLKLWTSLLRLKFRRRGRGSSYWIHQNHLLNPYVQTGVMISLWNMMSRNLELIHTLVCTALYIDNGEGKYLPQFFKFVVANPLSVRTKETTYLEACIENHTKTNLYMDQVVFEPAPHWSATVLKLDEL